MTDEQTTERPAIPKQAVPAKQPSPQRVPEIRPAAPGPGPTSGLAAALGSLMPGVGAVAVVVAITIRILAAAAYDPATALALVGSAGELTVIVGALIATLPYVSLALVLAAAGAARRPVDPTVTPAAPRSLLLAGGWLAGVLLVFIAPWYFPVLALILGPLLAWLSEPRRRRRATAAEMATTGWHAAQRIALEQMRKGSRRAAALGVVVVTTLFLTRLDVWAPTERLEITGQEPVVAYVMSVDNDWTTLLTFPSRRVLRVRSESVTSRSVCQPEAAMDDARTLWELISPELPGSFNVARPPDYPQC